MCYNIYNYKRIIRINRRQPDMNGMKKIFTLFLTFAMLLGVTLFASCNKDKDTGAANAYTIVVQYADKTPATGVTVKLCTVDEQGNEISCLPLVDTDANGKAVFSDVAKAVYHVSVLSDEYAVDGDVYTNAAYETVTIKLVPLAE